MGMWQTIRASALGRHDHVKAYAALVISGGYEEAGDHGRFRVKAGDVIFHEPFETHLDRFSETGAVVLNLGLPLGRYYEPGIASVADADAVARVAERSCLDAIELLFSLAVTRTPQPADWPDELAAALMRNPSLKLSLWGETWALTKPEVNFLILITTFVGSYLASASDRPGLFNTLLETLLGASGTGTLNQYLERKFDAHMRRTARRRTAAGRLTPSAVLAFGAALAVVASIYLVIAVNLLGSRSHGGLPRQRTLFSCEWSSAASRWWRCKGDFLSQE
jgi:hypothetical protein